MEIAIEFKQLIDQDIIDLRDALSDVSNSRTPEFAKQELYKEITAKYHPYIPKLGDGLYNYYDGFYDDVKGDSLYHNLNQVLNKLIAFKATGYPSLIPVRNLSNNSIVLNANYSNQNTNNNSNSNFNYISFSQVREQLENMTSLPEIEIEGALHKLSELEQIVKSSDRRSKKWENAKEIIKWIADKGVDIGIAFLPLLLQIK